MDLQTAGDEVARAMEGLRPMARMWSRDPDAAEDLLQDTAVRALRGLHRYRSGSNATAWCRSIMYHLAVDRSRRRRREWAFRLDFGANVARIASSVSSLDEGPYSGDAFREAGGGRDASGFGEAEVRQAALQLVGPVRDTFLLWLDERLSYRELAERLGIPSNTVATRLLRARQKVRALLNATARAMASRETA